MIARKGVKFCTFGCRILHLSFLEMADFCGFSGFLLLDLSRRSVLLGGSTLERCPSGLLYSPKNLRILMPVERVGMWVERGACGQAVGRPKGCPRAVHGRSAARRAIHIPTRRTFTVEVYARAGANTSGRPNGRATPLPRCARSGPERPAEPGKRGFAQEE
jgi:hypothetical protein